MLFHHRRHLILYRYQQLRQKWDGRVGELGFTPEGAQSDVRLWSILTDEQLDQLDDELVELEAQLPEPEDIVSY